MMMTSTYPGSRSNHNINHGLKEIQSKKEALMSLETSLKKRVNEFKELCLKEGELTGHLPIDYPLQPREPIPQIRRRVRSCSRTSSSSSSISNNNLNDTSNMPPKSSIRSQPAKLDQPVQSQQQRQVVFAIPTTNLNFPSRPTSTNSTSSSISTASSNTRSVNNAIINSQNHLQQQQQQQLSLNPTNKHQPLTNTNIINNNNNNNSHCFTTSNNSHFTDQVMHQLNSRNHLPIRYDPSMLPNHFKRPFNMAPAQTFDSDTLGHMRASSTASSSSSSGSGASSVLSAPPAVMNSTHINNGLSMNLHGRSCSESIPNDQQAFNLGSNSHMRPRSQDMLQRQQLFTSQMANLQHTNPNPVPPARPPRGTSASQVNRQTLVGTDTVDGNLSKQAPSENRSNLINTHQLQKDVKPLQHFNMNGLTNFQPFLEEETKPFQMSDFYKYSSKYRQIQKVSDPQKTTRQLQEDVSKKNSLKYSSCDDQLQALPKLFEKSGQKLIEATAKAIAGNPGLAEKLNNILPNNHHHHHRTSDNRY